MQATTASTLFDKEIMEHCDGEYFPVAPVFFTAELKDKLRALYQFARVTDNISDNHNLTRQRRLKDLHKIDSIIMGSDYSDAPGWLTPFCKLIEQGNIEKNCGRLLLSAFMQDLRRDRYESWDEVIDYCNRSAVPIGRAILDIFDEKKADKDASDNLCYSLQILNHVKDMKEDYVLHDRVYFPVSWYENVADLSCDRSTLALEQVKHRVLDEVQRMLQKASLLPTTIKDLRLKLFYIYTVEAALLVLRKLRRTDPLKRGIKITIGERLIVMGRTFCQLLRCKKQR